MTESVRHVSVVEKYGQFCSWRVRRVRNGYSHIIQTFIAVPWTPLRLLAVEVAVHRVVLNDSYSSSTSLQPDGAGQSVR